SGTAFEEAERWVEYLQSARLRADEGSLGAAVLRPKQHHSPQPRCRRLRSRRTRLRDPIRESRAACAGEWAPRRPCPAHDTAASRLAALRVVIVHRGADNPD